MQATKTPWLVVGNRALCKIFVNRDLNHARRLLAIAPSLINLYHPLGWAPLHAVILSGDPSLVKFVLELPGVDIAIKDKSTFNATSSAADILCRQEELCPSICGTESTSGATALHFACMRGDWEILNLLLEAGASHDAEDNSKRLPAEYFDLERVNLETYKAYHITLRARRIRWRSLVKKDMTVLCDAIREGDHDFCKEILDAEPKLAYRHHRYGWTALHVAVMNQKPAIVNLILSHSTAAIDAPDSWGGSAYGRASFASDMFAHRAMRESTALHYACLLGDMEIVEALLRHGAKWTIADENNLLPEHCIDVSNGDDKRRVFNRLCEEELMRSKKREEEKELQQTKNITEEEQSNLSEQREDETESEEEEEEELKQVEKPAEGEELIKRRKRQNDIEKIIGDNIIGQRGPIRSIASAIRLRDNGWVDPDRPLVMLFLGSSGVGKTELAKQVTFYLNGNESKHKTAGRRSLTEIEESGAFVRIDMSEYQHSHTVSNLTGSPKGYVGYDDGGVLTKKLRKNPRAIVLLDEIEKAHPDVLTVFLQVFDDGRITDPKLGTIYCQGAVFIMTSNLGSEEIRAASPSLHRLVAATENRHEQYLKSIGEFNKELYPVLKKSLKRDEFLGRINQIVVFLPLTTQEISQVIEIELKKWARRAKDHHAIRLSWSPKVIERLVEAYDMNYGARSVINEVQRVAIQILAESQIRGDIGKNWLAHLIINDAGDIDMVKEDPSGTIPLKRGCRYVI